MAQDIFTDDELKADQQGPGEITPPDGETAEQKAERDEQGRFKAKEPAAELPPEGEEGKDKGGTVPQGALHAERERRKAAEGETAKLREKLDAIAKLREQVASRKPEAMPAADDPAAIEHLRTRLAETENAVSTVTRRIDDEALNNAEVQQLGGFVQQSEARYRQEKPDYDEAINHVVHARAQELALYGLNPAQIQQTIAQEATEIARAAVAQGRDPAELGYQIALSRGYRPKDAEAGEQQGKSAAERTMEAIETAKRQGKSLGSAGGGKVQSLNAEAVLAMSPEEFDRVYSTPEGKAMIDNL